METKGAAGAGGDCNRGASGTGATVVLGLTGDTSPSSFSTCICGEAETAGSGGGERARTLTVAACAGETGFAGSSDSGGVPSSCTVRSTGGVLPTASSASLFATSSSTSAGANMSTSSTAWTAIGSGVSDGGGRSRGGGVDACRSCLSGSISTMLSRRGSCTSPSSSSTSPSSSGSSPSSTSEPGLLGGTDRGGRGGVVVRSRSRSSAVEEGRHAFRLSGLAVREEADGGW